MSMQQAYITLGNNHHCNFKQYLTYRKMAIQGYKLLKCLQHDTEIYGSDKMNFKEPPTKKPNIRKNDKCQYLAMENASNFAKKHDEHVLDGMNVVANIFKELASRGPKECTAEFKECGRYSTYKPKNSGNNQHFNLFVM